MKKTKKSTSFILDRVSIILVVLLITFSSCGRLSSGALEDRLVVYSKSFNDRGSYKYHYELQKSCSDYYFELFTNTNYDWQVGDTIELTKKENEKKD